MTSSDSTSKPITLRGIEPDVWARFRIAAAIYDAPYGQVANTVFKNWLNGEPLPQPPLVSWTVNYER